MPSHVTWEELPVGIVFLWPKSQPIPKGWQKVASSIPSLSEYVLIRRV